MIEKYLRKKITRTDLEKRILEKSLQERYAKYSGKKVVDSLLIIKTKIVDSLAKVKPRSVSTDSLKKKNYCNEKPKCNK